MAIDTSTLEATLQTKFDNVTDPKEMLLLGKAYEATVGGIAVSDIEAAGAAQVATINDVATSTFKTVSGQSILGTGDIAANDASALTTGTLSTDLMASGTVVNTVYKIDTNYYSGTTWGYAVPNLYIDYTPKYADSILIVETVVSVTVGGTTTGWQVRQDGAIIVGLNGQTGVLSGHALAGSTSCPNSSWSSSTASIGAIVAGSTTSRRYQVHIGAHNGSYTWYYNRTGSTNDWDGAARMSTMKITEIRP